jgi:hypothetical protein
MKYCIACICLLAAQSVFSQSPALEALDGVKSPGERYQLMKSKSQTYGDYKVIKEYILDRVWKFAIDSIQGGQSALRKADTVIHSLQKELKYTQAALQEKEAAQAEIVYASTHISFIGIGIEKTVFVSAVLLIIFGLVFLLIIIMARMKLMALSVKDNAEQLSASHAELEDFKRKSLDRQTKLSRELQTERNKLMELKQG